eukprot:UN02398
MPIYSPQTIFLSNSNKTITPNNDNTLLSKKFLLSLCFPFLSPPPLSHLIVKILYMLFFTWRIHVPFFHFCCYKLSHFFLFPPSHPLLYKPKVSQH